MQGTEEYDPADFKGKHVFVPFHIPVYQLTALSPSLRGLLTSLSLASVLFSPLTASSYKNPVITLDLTTKSRIIDLFFLRSQLANLFTAPLAMLSSSGVDGFTGKHRLLFLASWKGKGLSN